MKITNETTVRDLIRDLTTSQDTKNNTTQKKQDVIISITIPERPHSSIQINLKHCKENALVSNLLLQNGDLVPFMDKFKVKAFVFPSDANIQTKNQLQLGYGSIYINPDVLKEGSIAEPMPVPASQIKLGELEALPAKEIHIITRVDENTLKLELVLTACESDSDSEDQEVIFDLTSSNVLKVKDDHFSKPVEAKNFINTDDLTLTVIDDYFPEPVDEKNMVDNVRSGVISIDNLVYRLKICGNKLATLASLINERAIGTLELTALISQGLLNPVNLRQLYRDTNNNIFTLDEWCALSKLAGLRTAQNTSHPKEVNDNGNSLHDMADEQEVPGSQSSHEEKGKWTAIDAQSAAEIKFVEDVRNGHISIDELANWLKIDKDKKLDALVLLINENAIGTQGLADLIKKGVLNGFELSTLRLRTCNLSTNHTNNGINFNEWNQLIKSADGLTTKNSPLVNSGLYTINNKNGENNNDSSTSSPRYSPSY